MTGYEETLLARAEVLEDAGELVQAITAVLAGAQEAGADPAAVTSLQAAVRALDPGASTRYDAGSKEDRQPGGGYRSDGEFLEAAAEAEGDVLERLREAEKLQEQLAAAMDAAQAALDAAYAMPVKDECDGCHGIKAGRDRRCAAPHRAVRGRGRDPGSPRRAPPGSAGTAPAGPPGPRRGLPAGVRVHPQGRQVARLRPVDRRRKGAHLNAWVAEGRRRRAEARRPPFSAAVDERQSAARPRYRRLSQKSRASRGAGTGAFRQHDQGAIAENTPLAAIRVPLDGSRSGLVDDLDLPGALHNRGKPGR